VTGSSAPSSQTSILVRIPTPLRRLTGGQGEVTAEGRTVQDVLEALERQFPGVKERLYDEAGQLRRFVNIYVNDEDIRFAQGLETALKKGDELSIVPAIAGGESLPIRNERPKGEHGGSGRGGTANPKAALLENSSNDAAPKAGGPHRPLPRPMGQSNGARGAGASEDVSSLPDGPPHEMEPLWPA